MSKKHFNISNSKQNHRAKDHKYVDQGYHKNPNNFTHSQQKIRERLAEKRVINYTPGSGNKSTALFICTLILSGFCIEMANATNINSQKNDNGNNRNNKISDNSSKKDYGNYCNNTNIISQNKPEGSMIQTTQYGERIGFSFSYPPDTPNHLINDAIKFYENNQDHNIHTLRNNAVSHALSNLVKLYEEAARKYSEKPSEKDQNIYQTLIYNKFRAVSLVKSALDHANLGRCEEIASQAALYVMPELAKNEYFLKIGSHTKGNEADHTFGIIVTKDVLDGKFYSGLMSRKDKFLRLFSNKFFEDGIATIPFSENDNNAPNTAMFFEALGMDITRGEFHNPIISEHASICDPWMDSGLYCKITDCFRDERIKSLYLNVFSTIDKVEVFSWEIPQTLRGKLSKQILELNSKINKEIKTFLAGLKDIIVEKTKKDL